MRFLIQPLFVLVLVACLWSGDRATQAGKSDPLRAALYGLVTLLALISLIFMAFGLL